MHSKNKFNAGDIVKLKSGSHSMTVKGIALKPALVGTTPIPHKYECFWSDGKKPQQAIFSEDALMLV
jgi:uncharacterized protein YodC (DUF2158 family)